MCVCVCVCDVCVCVCECVPVKHTPPICVDNRGCLLLDGMISNFPILFDLSVSESSILRRDCCSSCVDMLCMHEIHSGKLVSRGRL